MPPVLERSLKQIKFIYAGRKLSKYVEGFLFYTRKSHLLCAWLVIFKEDQKLKKLLFLALAVVMLFAFAACGTDDAATDESTDTSEEVAADNESEEDVDEEEETDTETEADTSEETSDAIEWTVTIGDYELVSTGISIDTVTQTLQKQDKEGNLKDQECTGYTIASILELAGIEEFTTLTVVAADDYEYELTYDVAMLDTTMLISVQDGEAYELPRLGVEGEGSSAWVKDVVEIIAE